MAGHSLCTWNSVDFMLSYVQSDYFMEFRWRWVSVLKFVILCFLSFVCTTPVLAQTVHEIQQDKSADTTTGDDGLSEEEIKDFEVIRTDSLKLEAKMRKSMLLFPKSFRHESAQ